MRTIKWGLSFFLFAHQDDEFAVFSEIQTSLDAGREVVCIYMTNGSSRLDGAVRSEESREVLRRLGVSPSNVIFAGASLDISDLKLCERLMEAHLYLSSLFANLDKDILCYCPAWEGGHPDHDILHALTVKLSATIPIRSIFCFSLYHRNSCLGPFFRVMTPIPLNGKLSRTVIPLRKRFLYSYLCLKYPSQWKSWLGLFPFVAYHYLLVGVQTIQTPGPLCDLRRPHLGELYYERRKFFNFVSMELCLKQISKLK